MTLKAKYEQDRQKAAEMLSEFNRKCCIHFAEILRTHDEYKRLCAELGIPTEQIISERYFEIAYRVLSFGKVEDRVTMLLGDADAIDKLVQRIESTHGFHDEKGFFIEV